MVFTHTPGIGVVWDSGCGPRGMCYDTTGLPDDESLCEALSDPWG